MRHKMASHITLRGAVASQHASGLAASKANQVVAHAGAGAAQEWPPALALVLAVMVADSGLQLLAHPALKTVRRWGREGDRGIRGRRGGGVRVGDVAGAAVGNVAEEGTVLAWGNNSKEQRWPNRAHTHRKTKGMVHLESEFGAIWGEGGRMCDS